MIDREPSARNQIFNLVKAHAYRTKLPPAKVWSNLYREFEHDSNKRIKQLANYNHWSLMTTVQNLGLMNHLLEFARGYLIEKKPSTAEITA